MNYTREHLETALTATLNKSGEFKIEGLSIAPYNWTKKERSALQTILDNLPKQECEHTQKRTPEETRKLLDRYAQAKQDMKTLGEMWDQAEKETQQILEEINE